MIKIDLGKDEVSAGSSKDKLAFLDKVKLPKGLKLKLRKRPKLTPATILIPVVALVLAVIPGYFFDRYKSSIDKQHQVKVKELNENLAGLSREIATLTPYQSELKSYEQQKTLVANRLQAVQALLTTRGTPVNVLDTIGQSLPSRTWVNSVKFDANSGKKGILINGQSYSNDEISDYVDKLTDSIYLKEVQLKSVTTGQLDGVKKIPIRVFQIAALPKWMP